MLLLSNIVIFIVIVIFVNTVRKKLIIAFLLACLASNCGIIKLLPGNGPLKIDMYQQHQQLSHFQCWV